MTAKIEWLVAVDDGSDPARLEIRSERVVPPCVFVDLRMATRLLTPVEAAQLGQALQDAARSAAQLGVNRGRSAR